MTQILNRLAPTEPDAPLPGFEGLQRFWEPENGRWTVKILPGEYYVTRSDEAITTVLGSCISACIRDPVRRVGGMNHFMLPEEGTGRGDSWLATRYGLHAMESLINDLLKLGAARERLEIKLFGGGRILSSLTDVGARNIEFVQNFLRIEGFTAAAQDLGSTSPRKVVYFPATGRVRVRKLRPIENRAIGDRERHYLETLRSRPQDGEIELFE